MKRKKQTAQGHHRTKTIRVILRLFPYGAEGGRGRKKNLRTNSGEGLPTREYTEEHARSTVGQIAAGIAPIHHMAHLAESAGWPLKDAFEATMQLLCHGCTVTEGPADVRGLPEWVQ
jgi:hypothetical protein